MDIEKFLKNKHDIEEKDKGKINRLGRKMFELTDNTIIFLDFLNTIVPSYDAHAGFNDCYIDEATAFNLDCCARHFKKVFILTTADARKVVSAFINRYALRLIMKDIIDLQEVKDIKSLSRIRYDGYEEREYGKIKSFKTRNFEIVQAENKAVAVNEILENLGFYENRKMNFVIASDIRNSEDLQFLQVAEKSNRGTPFLFLDPFSDTFLNENTTSAFKNLNNLTFIPCRSFPEFTSKLWAIYNRKAKEEVEKEILLEKKTKSINTFNKQKHDISKDKKFYRENQNLFNEELDVHYHNNSLLNDEREL